MRLPNGYGSITKLSGKRRKPYIVRVSCGYGDDCEIIRKVLGYYESYKKASIALANYNQDPYDIDGNKLTFSELFELWSEEKYKQITPSAQRTYKSAYSYCTPIYNDLITEIKTQKMQDIIDTADVGANTRARIQSMLKLMFKWAIEHEYLRKDYAQFLKRPKIEVNRIRTPFSNDEINTLWKHKDEHMAKLILIHIYTGWRPDELCELNFLQNIDLENMTAKGGKKTSAGKNRIVPFNDKIKPFITEFHKKGYSHITTRENGTVMNYGQYYRDFKEYISDLGMNHIPHECRHTFATLLDNAEINSKTKKLLLGHSSTDITEKVYTHKTIDQLKEAVNSI